VRGSRAGGDSAHQSVPARAMAAASRLFLSNEPTNLLDAVARTLAADPGRMCVVSLTGTDGSLRPLAVEHRSAKTACQLRTALELAKGEWDAFSRTAQHTGRPVRVPIGGPNVARLWLPKAYWEYGQAGLSCALAIPLVRFGQVVGTLLLLRERGQPLYTPDHEAFLSRLAARMTVGLRLG
jgi:GAF domain-containing protein